MRSPRMTRLALLVAGLTAAAVHAEPPKSGPGNVKDPVEKKSLDPKPMPSVGLPKIDPKRPPLKVDPTPKVDPKPDLKPLPKAPVTLPPIDPVKPPVIKPGFPIPTGSDLKPEVKTKPIDRPVLVHERPKVAGAVDLPKGPGLKLPKDANFDRAEL